jgi:hypothetical protein
MTTDETPEVDAAEHEARVRHARHGILVIAIAFYVLLMLMCAAVFILVFVVAR